MDNIIVLKDLSKLGKFDVFNLVKDNTNQVFVVFPHEWETKRHKIINHVNSYNNPNARIYYARQCEIKSLELSTARKFIAEYHIQGSNNLGIVAWGIYFKNELLGVMTLGKHSRQNVDGILLDRLCFKDNVRVIGGASKLFSRAVKWASEKGISRIISFSDNRFSSGNIYEKLKFSLDNNLPPDYFYVERENYLIYHSKQSQKKSNTNCPVEITEKEWSEQKGLIRVYDAGKKRWVYKLRLHRDILNSMSSRRHGYYESKKASILYYQSSYELRAMVILDNDENVDFYTNQVIFYVGGQKRYIDFVVKYKNGTYKSIEVKPIRMLEKYESQINDNIEYAKKNNWEFEIWTEKDLGFQSEHYATKWADEFLSTIKQVDFVAERKKRNNEKQKKYYRKHTANDKVPVDCSYCNETHFPLRITYEKNIERNGTYICERKGGFIAGSKPKLKGRGNPLYAEGKKQCKQCKVVKDLSEFSTGKATCKECRSKVYKERYHEGK